MKLTEDEQARFYAQTKRRGACRIWTGPASASGTPVFRGTGGSVSARRVAYELRHGKAPPRSHRCVTTCGKPLCVRHVAVEAKAAGGRKGKLTPAQVREASRLMKLRATDVSALAQRLNVSRSTLYRAVKRAQP